MTFSSERPEFIQAMFDDTAWAAHVATVGIIGARTELCQMKGELKIQRRARIGTPEYAEFVRKQGRFELAVSQRLREVESELTSNPEASGRRHRERITELTNLVEKLALAIDETNLDHLLEELVVPLGSERMTLAQAIDSGRFTAKTDTEAVAS